MSKLKYKQRFSEVIQLLTDAKPPTVLVESWLDNTSDDLQVWIINQLGDSWPQGIAVIDAAIAMADQPKEGLQEEICYNRPTTLELTDRVKTLGGIIERLENNIEALEKDNEELSQYIIDRS